jgi:hypothetical protein
MKAKTAIKIAIVLTVLAMGILVVGWVNLSN